MSDQLVRAIADMREEEALTLVREMVASGVEPVAILDAAREAMAIVGQRYQEGAYFLPELMLAGEMLTQITGLLKPELARVPEVKRHGKVLIGTVKGDIHDIGKNIVTFMLDVSGFDVLDLGVDVSSPKFVEAIRSFQPQVIGLSGFLTLAFDTMKETIEAIEAAGLRDGVKIMIGGGQVTEEIRQYAGADAYGRDAMSAVTLARQWIGTK
ncbi:MAG TPA: cobalamin-dependent protein [Anaerolineae bacterium]|nr:cobalamin-dependent protein [Anaerolineae bacterium]HOQ99379.1 cobalamin-dependent protein [Anaerolineae bacterium]HPL28468.1 cobalamin-dependent protein [Anaerolineae bacterium]